MKETKHECARTAPISDAETVCKWLAENMPESPPPTLLHNDWKLDNMALASDDPGRCVAVYDWDMCTTGDPLCDVGTLMCSWRNRDEPSAQAPSMPSQVEGFMDRDEALARYAERSGRDLAEISYYLVFGLFKMGVVVQQIYFRLAHGQTQDQRFAGMGQAAAILFQRAARQVP